jgi:hypothetical protein
MVDIRSLPEKWLPVLIAPSDIDLEVCVMERSGVHALIFPVRRNKTDWVDAKTKSASTLCRRIGVCNDNR